MSPELIEAVTKTCTYFKHVADMKNCTVCKKRRKQEKKKKECSTCKAFKITQ